MEMTFFDSNGKPIAYTEDGEHVFLFSGQPVAFISENSIYAFSGKHIGFLDKGWVRDHAGGAVLFSENAGGGGPMKPLKQLKPLKSLKQLKPLKGLKQLKPLKSMNSLGWSRIPGDKFFG